MNKNNIAHNENIIIFGIFVIFPFLKYRTVHIIKQLRLNNIKYIVICNEYYLCNYNFLYSYVFYFRKSALFLFLYSQYFILRQTINRYNNPIIGNTIQTLKLLIKLYILNENCVVNGDDNEYGGIYSCSGRNCMLQKVENLSILTDQNCEYR